MTPTQLKEAAQVMLAAAEGKQVQYMPRSTGQWVPTGWAENDSPSWDWHLYEYRIKPEPREWWVDLNTGKCHVLEPSSTHNDVIKVREVI